METELASIDKVVCSAIFSQPEAARESTKWWVLRWHSCTGKAYAALLAAAMDGGMTDQSYEDQRWQHDRAKHWNDDAGMQDSHDPEDDQHWQHRASSVGWQDQTADDRDGIEDSWHSGADPWTKGAEGTAATLTTTTTPRGGQWAR